MENFIKSFDVSDSTITYLHEKFPRLSFERVKAGEFIGPEIRDLFTDQHAEPVIKDKEKIEWKSIKHVVHLSHKNFKEENFKERQV